jgi:hypothetical protein
MAHRIHPLLVLVLLTAGCSTPKPLKEQPQQSGNETAGETTHSWELGHYKIRFAAGPTNPLPEGGLMSFSTYSVTYHEEEAALLSVVAGSAMDIEMLVDSPMLKLKDHFGVWASPSERWLLIREGVPSDCGSCVNFLLFERLEEELRVSYLQLPTWSPPVNPVNGAKMRPYSSEYPEILKITEDEIEYQFSNKLPQSMKIRDVPTKKSVTFPG